MINDLVFLR